MNRTFQAYEPLVICLGLFLVLGNLCGGGAKPKEQKGTFEKFDVSPNPICTNVGNPIVRISWSVKGVGQTCLKAVKINGSDVREGLWSSGVQNGICGEGDYSRETAFSLREVFGNNVPSSIAVTANLTKAAQAGFGIDTTTPLDTGSANTTARECTPSVVP